MHTNSVPGGEGAECKAGETVRSWGWVAGGKPMILTGAMVPFTPVMARESDNSLDQPSQPPSTFLHPCFGESEKAMGEACQGPGTVTIVAGSAPAHHHALLHTNSSQHSSDGARKAPPASIQTKIECRINTGPQALAHRLTLQPWSCGFHTCLVNNRFALCGQEAHRSATGGEKVAVVVLTVLPVSLFSAPSFLFPLPQF
ncbi:hypothetical protein Cadr_000026009 [Camelus dromedarius]|uniref:Uncharacterized protein n=1 Tax=Camelus dromedarius TaxID=9838 RepID=A0A5N4CEV2_CAMDR|nr:hypothetical protein Cadr_000026009 [Camelus dromedarius]